MKLSITGSLSMRRALLLGETEYYRVSFNEEGYFT
jgi:hypothetical protein